MFSFRKKKKESPAGPWCAAVVPAAGSSSRMGRGDKVLLPLGGQPVLARTLRALEDSPAIMEIVVVTKEDLLVAVSDLCRQYGFQKVTTVLVGGKTRTESVMRGLSAVSSRATLVAVHDGARPLVTPEVIAAAVSRAAQCGAACPAIPVKDTVKQVSGGSVAATLDRDSLRAVQTPQVFDRDLLQAALQKAAEENAVLTDDCAAVERLGAAVALTPGDERNLKITTPLDLAVAEAILSQEV